MATRVPGCSRATADQDVTDALHRDPQERRPGPCREGERVSLPPHPPCEEAPLEELTPRHREAVEVPAPADDRDRVRSFRMDLHDLEAVPERPVRRKPDRDDGTEAHARGPEQGPDDPRERVPHERRSERVLVTSSAAMRSLNRRFRRKNKPTDVLSFPAPQAANAGKKFAGEIAISADIAARNALRLGHSLAAEIKILALHGVLHLAGFDHERDNGAMGRKETQLRRLLRLPTSLIEREQPGARAAITLRTSRPPYKKRRPA